MQKQIKFFCVDIVSKSMLPRSAMASKMEDHGGICENNSVQVNSDDFEEIDTDNVHGNPKLADALNKVLRMTKKKPRDKSVILSKAKLHTVKVKKDTCDFEIEPNPNGEVPEIKDEEDIKPDIKEDKRVKKIGLTVGISIRTPKCFAIVLKCC